MMFFFIFFAIATLFFYFKMKFGRENEDVLFGITVLLGVSTFIVFFLLFLQKGEFETNMAYLLFIPFFIFGIYYISNRTKPKSLEVIANQQRYFNEIDRFSVIDFYSTRRDIKKNRIEVLVNKHEKKLIKDGVIIPQFFIDYKNFQATHIKNIAELESSKVFSVVFKKIKGFVSDREVKIDYEKILTQNDNIAEFFLMELWEEHTKSFNISLANLEILATNAKEREFIGALDLLNLNCVKRNGAVLFYKYMDFKDRIKDYAKNEHLNINPQEKEFDEKYAKENDSDALPYSEQYAKENNIVFTKHNGES